MPHAIGFMTGATFIGGAEKSMQELIHGLRGRGTNCHLIAPEASASHEWATKEGVAFHAFDFRKLRESGPGNALRQVLRLRRSCRALHDEHGIDCFYSHNHTAFTYLALLPSRYLRVAHQRDADMRRSMRLLLRRVDHNIFISEFGHTRMGAPKNATVVLNNGAFPERIFASLRPAPPVRMVMFARYDWWKGHHLAIGAMERLAKAGRDVRLDIFGEPNDGRDAALYERLKEAAARSGARIEFKGYHPRPVDVMGEYHLILNPSKDEPFGRVPVEGFSAGVPVVSHASGGSLEIYSGSGPYEDFLFGPYSADGLASCIDGLIARLEAPGGLDAAVGELGRDIRRRFSISRVLDEVTAVFAALEAGRR